MGCSASAPDKDTMEDPQSFVQHDHSVESKQPSAKEDMSSNDNQRNIDEEQSALVNVEQESARVKAQQGAAVQAAQLKAEQEAAEEAARLQAEQEAAEEAARLKAEQEAAEEAARLQAEQEAAEEAARLKAEQEAAEAAKGAVKRKAEDGAVVLLVQQAVSDLVMETELRVAEDEQKAAENKRIREAMYILAMVTDIKKGWLSHQSGILKTFSKRYFVLSKGVLRFYSKPLDVQPYGQDLRGEVTLDDHVLKELSDTMFEIQTIEDSNTVGKPSEPGLLRRLSQRRKSSSSSLVVSEGQSMVLEASSPKEADDWLSVMQIQMNHFHSAALEEKTNLVQNVYFKGAIEVKGFFWSKRYAVLTWNKLEYFTDKTLTEKVGTFQIIPDSTKVLLRPDNESTDTRFRFGLTNGESTLELAVSSDQERSDWLLMITRVGFREFGKYDDSTATNATSPPPNTPVRDNQSINKSASPHITASLEAEEDRLLETEAGNVLSEINFDCDSGEMYYQPSHISGGFAMGNQATESDSQDKSLFLLFPSVNDTTSSPSKYIEEGKIDGSVVSAHLEDSVEEERGMSYVDIRGEVKGLFFKLNQGHTYDHKRLQSLLHTLDSTPLYAQMENHSRDKWLGEVSEYATECFEIQQAYVPSDIFYRSYTSLTEDTGGVVVATPVARRLFLKKALWLVRMSPDDISRMSVSELNGRFNATNESLDIVELFAIFHVLPNTFCPDPHGEKRFWKQCIEENIKHLYLKKLNNSLRPHEIRNNVYLTHKPQFEADRLFQWSSDACNNVSKDMDATENEDNEQFASV